MALKFTAKDMRGVVSMNPTPSTPNAGSWRETMSVDLKRSEELFNKTLASGTSGYALCGTTGECSCLLWDEKLAYIKCAVDTVKKRGYVFAGCTALGTKEVIRQMREMQKAGADGAFVGLPLWQTPTVENSTQFYADLSDALPDFSIMIYSNASFFKTNFPHDFWKGIGQKAHSVVTNKITYSSEDLAKDMDACPNVQFLPGLGSLINLSRQHPGRLHGCWTTQPYPEIMAAMVKAVEAKDADGLARIEADLKAWPSRNPPPVTPEPTGNDWTSRMGREFAHYNSQVEREGWNASKFLPGGVGPARPPYTDLPDRWKTSTAVWAKHGDELIKKYQPVKK